MTLIRLILIVFLLPSLALAQETYSPDFCDFEITFPEKPYKVQRCDEDNQNRCYNLVSFTRVFQMTTTVNFRVICNPISNTVRENYSGDVMAATLKAMTKKSVVSEFSTSYSEEEHYKMAGLVGEGKVGRTPTIYIAQLWIGDNSAFSVEAELIGQIDESADQLFSDILRSIRFSEEESEEETQEEVENSKPESENQNESQNESRSDSEAEPES